jgi:hypothetical protein
VTRQIPYVLVILLAAFLVACGITAISQAAAQVGDAGIPTDAPLPPVAEPFPIAPAGGPAPPVAVQPEPTVDDVRGLWRHGEYLGAGLLALFGLFAIALKADPRRALYYTAGIAALGGCVDLVANGQTPNAGMLIGAAAVFLALIMRSPLPPVSTRPPESGHVHPLIAIVFGGMLTIGAFAAWSCSSTTRRAVRDTAADIAVDCTSAVARAHLSEYGATIEAALRAALRSDGTVDSDALKRSAAGYAIETGWCAAAAVFARMLAEMPTARVAPGGYDPAAGLRAAWQAVRPAGRTFDLGGGTRL